MHKIGYISVRGFRSNDLTKIATPPTFFYILAYGFQNMSKTEFLPCVSVIYTIFDSRLRKKWRPSSKETWFLEFGRQIF